MIRPVDFVCLDAGGVLLFPNWARVSDALASHGVRVAPVALAAADPHAKRAMDSPAAIRSTNNVGHGWLYFDHVLLAAGIEPGPDSDAALLELRAAHAERNLWEIVPPEVPPTLARLRDAGFRLTVVSNSDGRLHDLLDRTGLGPLVDVVLDSHEVGIEKPDPGLFHVAMARSGGTPDRAVHVGDFYELDVVGARAAGLEGILLDPLGLYADADCPRIASLTELPDAIRGLRPQA